MNRTLNKKELIEHTVEMNIYYQGYKEETEIDVIGEQKWNMILGMLQLAYYNSEIDQRIEKVKMMKYLEECGKQQRPKQRKSGQQKQKKEEEKESRKKTRRERKEKKAKKEKRSIKDSRKIGDLE